MTFFLTTSAIYTRGNVEYTSAHFDDVQYSLLILIWSSTLQVTCLSLKILIPLVLKCTGCMLAVLYVCVCLLVCVCVYLMLNILASIITEPFGTEVVDPPTDKHVICLQTFIGFHLLFEVVRNLKEQIVV